MAAQVLPQIFAQGGVQRRQWLVQQEQAGTQHHRAGQSRALLLTAGKLPWILPGRVCEIITQQDFLNAFTPGGFAEVMQAVADVGGHGQMGEEGVVLKHKADAALWRSEIPPGGRIEPGFLAKLNGPLLRALQPRQTTQHGGLATAGRAKEHRDVAHPKRLLQHAMDGDSAGVTLDEVCVQGVGHGWRKRRCSA